MTDEESTHAFATAVCEDVLNYAEKLEQTGSNLTEAMAMGMLQVMKDLATMYHSFETEEAQGNAVHNIGWLSVILANFTHNIASNERFETVADGRAELASICEKVGVGHSLVDGMEDFLKGNIEKGEENG